MQCHVAIFKNKSYTYLTIVVYKLFRLKNKKTSF